MGSYDSPEGRSLDLATLKRMLCDAGVRRLYCKHLACNDNSKNQPYFGPDLTSINIIPTGPVAAETTTSRKPGGSGKKILKAPIDLNWLTPDGQLLPAPNSKIIHYPQYPETRFSGFLSGSKIDMSEWMDPGKQGRNPDRFLLLGVTDTRMVVGYLAIPESAVSRELLSLEITLPKLGVFFEVPLTTDEADNRRTLLAELKRISQMGWIESVRLDQTGFKSCNSPNCGGYTLEAHLGIFPNGFSEPDFLGWEVKQFGVTNFSKLDSAVITLMTPEPNGGVYVSAGVESFIRKYGYPDTQGRPDRFNFGGVHKFSIPGNRTKLTLQLLGFNVVTGKIEDLDGGIALLDEQGVIAALWRFTKLIDHWKRKHNRAIYIPSMTRMNDIRQYKFGDTVRLCTGTDFLHVLSAIQLQSIYYDPGIKLENASTNPTTKRRSQFRIKSRNIASLYNLVETVSLEAIDP